MNTLPLRRPPAVRSLLRFALLSVGFYLLWFFGYERGLALDGHLDNALTHNIAVLSAAGLRLMGFAASVSSTQANLVLLQGVPTVVIAPYCDGMVLYALFAGFVLAFPGSHRHKLWFVPVGTVLIYLVNVLRIIVLCLNHHYSHQTVDFNHHYTFTFIEYWFIFLLWIWWTTRFASRPPTSPIHAAYA